ncbi:hypothetical protein [Eubacterium ramulus]
MACRKRNGRFFQITVLDISATDTIYLVIEDNFPNGRPRLERAGILFADCRIVECVKQMNVCTCLNPFHTRLAIFTSIVFGQDLSKTELAEPVIGFLKEMLTGPHAVRKTLEKYLGQ